LKFFATVFCIVAKKFTPIYNIQAKSASECDILIYGPIGGSFWGDGNPGKKFVQDFKAAESKYDRINIRINSPGGQVDEGLPMFNAIKASKKDVHTYNDGIAYSMGAMLLLAGKTVHAAKGSLVMLHNVSGGCMGNANDLRQCADSMDVYDGVLGQLIADKTGKTLDQVKKDWFNYNDHFMSAQTACDSKLVDVVEDYSTEPMPDNAENLNSEQLMAFYQPEAGAISPEAVASLTETIQQNIIKNLKNDNMGLFGSKTPKLDALKGKKAAEITDEMIKEVIAELNEQGFEVVMITNAHLLEAEENATAITAALTSANAALGEQKKPTLAEAVTALVAEMAAWKKKAEEYGEQPGATPTNPQPANPDPNAATAKKHANGLPIDPKFDTSYDKELAERNKALKV
jgi:ATP-dependent Clp endopeptidase proteolytic subunit ClpP